MTPDEVAARTAARMEHLKQILSPEEWAQVVAGSQSHCTCGGTWPCTGPAWMGDHSPVSDEDRVCERCGDAVQYLSSDYLCDGCVAYNDSRVAL